jgi:vancomycin resistance protein YoaR
MQSTLPASQARDHTFAQLRRNTTDFLAIFLTVLLLLELGSVAAWQFWHADRIFSGVMVAGVPVSGATRANALVRLNNQLTPYPLAPVTIRYEEQQWSLSNAQLDVQADLLDAVNRAYLVGRRGNILVRLREQWLALTGNYDIAPKLTFNEGQIRYLVSQIAEDVRRPGRPAMQMGQVYLAAQPGIDVDVAATTEAILAALQQNRPAEVPLQVVAVAPPDAAQPLAPGQGRTEDPSEVFVLKSPTSGLEFALDPPALDRILLADDPIRIDESALRSVVEGWARQIDLPAKDARLRFDPATGAVTVREPSMAGRRLNVEQTIAAVRQALSEKRMEATLAIETVPPAVDMNKIAEMGIRELVATGTTYFAGSSRARIHNIEVAASKFEGVVIPPGGIFSFNNIVEDVSGANGFEDSLIIWGDRTAVGVGGGVCQVSTTVFRAALQAGFPLVERYNHGYVVSWYGKPGMDATIYTPTVDFKFRNDTDTYLLIEPVVDSVNGVISFQFYGTKPDRQVEISEPIISDVVKPGPPVYQVDPSLQPGQKKQVEYAKDGMTVVVERRITENGQTRVDKITSQYQPWQAVYLVGPGTEIPATPTPEATVTNTP